MYKKGFGMILKKGGQVNENKKSDFKYPEG